MSHVATDSAAAPVPHRWLDNFLFGLALFDAIMLVLPAGFVVWAIWPRPESPEGDLGAAARGYAVLVALLAMVVAWLIGLVATLVGRTLETRPDRRRGFNRLTAAYLVWVALGAIYLWYCQVA